MPPKNLPVVATILCLNALLGAPRAIAHAGERVLRDWTPEFSARLSYYICEGNNLSVRADAISATRLLTVSPDGRFFYVARRHGDVEHDENVYELLIWQSDAMIRALQAGKTPTPWKVLSHHSAASDDNLTALDQPRFIDGGKALLYLGADQRGVRNVFRLDMGSGQVEQLTNHQSDVTNYRYRDGLLLISDHAEGEPAVPPPLRYPMQPVERVRNINTRRFGESGEVQDRFEKNDWEWRFTYRGFAQRIGGRETELEGMMLVSGGDFQGSATDLIAADGKNVIYRKKTANGELRIVAVNPTNRECRELAKGMPAALFVNSFLSPDGQHVLVAGAVANSPGYAGQQGAVVILDPVTGKQTDIARMDEMRVGRWLSSTTFRILGNNYDRVYELQGSTWIDRPTRADESAPNRNGTVRDSAAEVVGKLPNGLEVQFQEGLNTPPVLIAKFGEQSAALTEPDPLLKEVWMGKAEPFSWTEEAKLVTGRGLIRLPRNYQLGTRIPFVIVVEFADQAHFYPDESVVGAATGPIQSLLAQEIGVIQITPTHRGGTPAEPKQTLSQIEEVTRALIASGKADPSRLGIVGFSRTGFFANLAITHPGEHPFAAAIADDSFQGSYSSYLGMAGSSVDEVYGGSFWDAKDGWLASSPEFNLDRVRTPMMFTIHHGSGASAPPPRLRNNYSSFTITQIAGFDLARRPVEYLVFPDGSHQLQRPKEIIAIQQATVDWFCFWLKGEVPANSVFAERWLRLRDMQQKVLDDLAAKGTTVASLPLLVKPTK